MVNRYVKINLKTRIIIAHAARPNEDRKRKERKISPIISAILNFADNPLYSGKNSSLVSTPKYLNRRIIIILGTKVSLKRGGRR